MKLKIKLLSTIQEAVDWNDRRQQLEYRLQYIVKRLLNKLIHIQTAMSRKNKSTAICTDFKVRTKALRAMVSDLLNFRRI